MAVARFSCRKALVANICFCFGLALPSPAARADGNAYSDAALSALPSSSRS